MKQTLVNIILIIALLGIGFLVGQSYVAHEVQTITKTDTVKVSYDSVYISGLEQNNQVLSKKYKGLLAYIRSRKPDTVKDYRIDTLIIEKEKKPVYSSNFRIGADTLNATGIVAFDFSRFYFNNVKFHYPSKTKVITKLIPTPYCTLGKKAEWFTIGTAIGIVVAKIFIH